MKLKLIMPRSKRLAKNSSRWLMPPFGLTMIAALTPKTFKVSLEDENVEELNLAEDVDLVGISSFTTNVERGYEIADIYRNRGTPVVMGGFHVSAMPEEALQHADAVLIGEAEKIWDTVLEASRPEKWREYIRRRASTPWRACLVRVWICFRNRGGSGGPLGWGWCKAVGDVRTNVSSAPPPLFGDTSSGHGPRMK